MIFKFLMISYYGIIISSIGIFLDTDQVLFFTPFMPEDIDRIPSPAVLLDADAMEDNLRRMQASCDQSGVELWPHIKTHKMVAALRRQLELGARGATCAKIGEAEALLPSGVRRIFIAHSLADLRKAPRLKALHDHLDQLVLAVTSERHCDALEKILTAADISVSVLMAVDTGLNREGVRSPEQASALAKKIRNSSRMKLIGLYTHEGHAYQASSPEEVGAVVSRVHAQLIDCVHAVGGELPLWPGCSVTAALMAHQPGVKAVRPGSYIFGDMTLTEKTRVMPLENLALTILATVVDRPDENLALIDAGSKVFSGDKSAAGLSGRCLEFPALVVSRVSEEHGMVTGEGVDQLQIGQRLRFQTAHVCPVLNLASQVHVVRGNEVLEIWPVDARGRSD